MMSNHAFRRWGIPSVVLAVVLAVSLLGASVRAAPPDPGGSLLGITPTPTLAPIPSPTPGPTKGPDVGVVDPAITKRGEPREAIPGEAVTFTLEVTNHGQHAAVDVVVTDEIDQFLEIVEVTTTQGTVVVEGQLITVYVGVVGPDFVVEIVIRTRVHPDAPVPLDLVNVAELRSPNGGNRVSPPVIIPVPSTSYLPQTGGAMGSVWMASVFLVLTAVAFAVGLLVRKRAR